VFSGLAESMKNVKDTLIEEARGTEKGGRWMGGVGVYRIQKGVMGRERDRYSQARMEEA
jgi:hypothetical protein